MKKILSTVFIATIAIAVITLSERSEGKGGSEEVTSQGSIAKENQEGVNISERAEVEIPAPLTDREEQIIRHTGYTLSYNRGHNTANWSAWELTAAETEGEVERGSKFWADPSIEKAYRVEWYEYKGSGYDRGHLCPAADMKWSEDAMHDCFYMSNMCPQEPRLNSGAWKKLEERCREWAIREGAIYIVCGPIYEEGKTHERIGIDHAIDVPERFFKVVMSLRKGKEKAIGFLYTNSTEKQSIKKVATTVDRIEEITGIDFFPSLADSIEDRIEDLCNLSEWE